MAYSVPPIRPKVFETPSPVYAVPGLLRLILVLQAPASQFPAYVVPGPLHLILVLVDSLLPPLRWLTSPA